MWGEGFDGMIDAAARRAGVGWGGIRQSEATDAKFVFYYFHNIVLLF